MTLPPIVTTKYGPAVVRASKLELVIDLGALPLDPRQPDRRPSLIVSTPDGIVFWPFIHDKEMGA